jgi:hypothetical protein
MSQRLLYGSRSYLVKLDALATLRSQLKNLNDVPAYCLSLPIGIAREVHLRYALQALAQLREMLLLLRNHHIVGLETVIYIHGQAALWQVPNVPTRG